MGSTKENSVKFTKKNAPTSRRGNLKVFECFSSFAFLCSYDLCF